VATKSEQAPVCAVSCPDASPLWHCQASLSVHSTTASGLLIRSSFMHTVLEYCMLKFIVSLVCIANKPGSKVFFRESCRSCIVVCIVGFVVHFVRARVGLYCNDQWRDGSSA